MDKIRRRLEGDRADAALAAERARRQEAEARQEAESRERAKVEAKALADLDLRTKEQQELHTCLQV